MFALRVVGGLFAAGLFAAAVVRYRRAQVSRLNLIITWLIALAIVLLAAWPNLFNPIFDVLNFRPGTGQRLTGALMIAVIILFALVFRMQTYVDSNERSMRLLVEALAQKDFDWERAEASVPDGPKIVTVSPAYNEAENVGAVIHAMPDQVEGYNIVSIVVDDSSDDGTAAAAADAGALVVSLPIRRGGGLALRVGYDVALRLGGEIVVTLDADGQHQPEEIPILVKPILEDEADHVNGSRMLGEYERGAAIRHVGVHFFSWLVTILTGQRVTDISSGYRATRASTLRNLLLEQDQFWTSEVTIEALRQRARIVEVPVTFLTRRGGESKKPKSLRYGWNFTKAIAKTWLR
jgi:hypothetical protein